MVKMFIVESENRCPYHSHIAGLKWTACNHPKYLFDAALKMCEGLESETCPLDPAPPKDFTPFCFEEHLSENICPCAEHADDCPYIMKDREK